MANPMIEALRAAAGKAGEKIAANHAEMPSLGAQLGAAFRGGREDLWNAAVPAFPDSMQASREAGAPGSPTPQMTTADLMKKDVDPEMPSPQTDVEMDR